MKLLVGVPMLAPSFEFFLSWTNLWTQLVNSDFEVGFKFTHRIPGHIAQESFAESAIATDCDYLLMMDDDIYDVTIKDVYTLLDADKDVISGIMYSSKNAKNLCAKILHNPDDNVSNCAPMADPFRMVRVPESQQKGVVPVDLTSLGLTLIKVSVFDKVEKPYFFDPRIPMLTDSAFFGKCRVAGIQPYAHFDVWLNHRGVTRELAPAWARIHKAQNDSDMPTLHLDDDMMAKHQLVLKQLMEDTYGRYKKERAKDIKFYQNTFA